MSPNPDSAAHARGSAERTRSLPEQVGLPEQANLPEHVDVLIVGAGISGIGAAYYLQRDHPRRSYAIVEARGAIGGTWDLFRYPGIRSDSDLHTFGYEFKPWRGDGSLAGGDEILTYLHETAAEFDIASRIHLRTKVVGASWSSPDARWTVEVEVGDDNSSGESGSGGESGGGSLGGDGEGGRSGTRRTLTCSWLLSATGYYRYDEGYTPRFEGRERFRGQIVHPQHWPADLDCAGKRVVVVGSGATAVTLVPALAATAKHVTMLQRTPTYILPMASKDVLSIGLRRAVGAERAHAIIRPLYIFRQQAIWRFCRRYPTAARRILRRLTRMLLPAGYPVDEHFNPPYDPWDQRLCIAPGADLFRTIGRGAASVVTDRITEFTEDGVLLESGRELAADVIVTATGLNLKSLGDVSLDVDGEPVRLPSTVSYKGLMLSGVPNFAYLVGYTNSSWTLKVGLLAQHLCRLLAHMDANGYDTACPAVTGPALSTQPFLDFGAGYIQRSIDELPRQGDRAPWRTSFDYFGDVRLLRRMPVEDDELRFTRARQAPTPTQTLTPASALTAAPASAPASAGQDERFCDLPNGMRLCYRIDEPDQSDRSGQSGQNGQSGQSGRNDPGGAVPVLLIAGLSLDLASWPESMVAGLLSSGLRVIRFDNRDVGRTTFPAASPSPPPPGRARLLLARPRPDAYSLAAMVEDTVGLLDQLGVARAHVVGMSMGGMIAQSLAARHGERVATLTSIFSTTGARQVGQPARSTLRLMARRPPRDREEAVARHLALLGHIGSATYPPDVDVESDWAARAWDRGPGPRGRAGVARQIGAIQASGNRTASLAAVTAPTLVIHGDADLMVHPSGGRATAAAITGARHVEITGLRHHLAPGVVDQLVELITDHTSTARASTARPAGEAPAAGKARTARSGAAQHGGEAR